MITWLRGPDDPLPDTRRALPLGSDVPGLLAAGGVLDPRRLTEAYSKGVFPWYGEGQPVLWWSPDPRMVLLTEEHAAQAHTVEAADELTVDPGLEAVHAPECVPGAVRLDHVGHDPGAVLPLTGRAGACVDDALERAIDAHFTTRAASKALDRLAQRA